MSLQVYKLLPCAVMALLNFFNMLYHGNLFGLLATTTVQQYDSDSKLNKLKQGFCRTHDLSMKVKNLAFIRVLCLLQLFKNKYKDEFYPYLLPKSHCTADSLSFTVPGSTKARVQVFMHTHSPKSKSLSVQHLFKKFCGIS